MIGCFIKGLGQLSDRRARRVVWIGFGVSLLVMAALWWSIVAVLSHTTMLSVGWLETVVDWLGFLAAPALTWFLFPAVVSATIGLFLEDIAAAVEARHYPHLAPVKGPALGNAVVMALKFLAILVVLNLLTLPFLLTPLFPFVFYSVNGYLLGREYFELVASRRLSLDDVKHMRRRHRGALFVAGVGVAFLLTVPLVNLLMPVVATASMLHLFEKWRPSRYEAGQLLER